MDELTARTLGEFVDFIRDVSPALWEIAKRQVQIHIALNAFWLLVFIGALYACVRWYKWAHVAKRTRSNTADYEVHEGFAVGFCITCAFLVMIVTGSILKRAINPDYYAILELSRMVTGL